MKIGLISDTHGWIHPRLFDYFATCDEIWHAGDIGKIETADSLAAFRPLRAVYGNVDDSVIRKVYNEHLFFTIEEVKVWITHIGGTPGHYDKKAGFLYVNPGASGYIGYHKYMTGIRFEIDGSGIHDLELIELGERGKLTTS